MKIEVELTQDETDLLCMMLGAGTASLHISICKIDNMLALVNKLMKDNPNFTPYAVSTSQRPQ